MRHRKAGLKLNRTASHRNAMFRNMVTSLLKHDRIRTTGARAMEVRRWADHLITLAKRGDLHARRQALSIVREKDVVHKLFEQADERFGAVSGGYTRVIKLGKRPGDAASMSMVELIALEGTKKKKKAKKKKTKSEGRQKKEAVDQKAPAAAKADEKEKASAKTKDEATDKKEVAEVEAKTKKPTVKGAAAKTSDEPSKVKTESAKVKTEPAKAKPESAKAKAEPTEGDTKKEKPAKKAKAAPKKPAATAEKKDAPDAATKKSAAKKPPKDEK